MPVCNDCGSHVSERFAKVMGNNNNQVWGCPNCGSNNRLSGRCHKPELDVGPK